MFAKDKHSGTNRKITLKTEPEKIIFIFLHRL